jgi:hypothetical protein
MAPMCGKLKQQASESLVLGTLKCEINLNDIQKVGLPQNHVASPRGEQPLTSLGGKEIADYFENRTMHTKNSVNKIPTCQF